MHDLRKKALLESGKTVSRKARSKPDSVRSSAGHTPHTSPGHSRPGSQPNSRPGSRYASEDEWASDGDYDDSMTMSTNSASDDAFEDNSAWIDRVRDQVAALQDRKNTSIEGRESRLASYLHLLRHHFAQDQIDGSFTSLVTALLRSIRSGGSTEERLLALKALSVTILTDQSATVFEQVYSTLKGVCQDAEEESLKSCAIQALAIAALYGGGSVTAYEELLEFFVEIVESDGASVDAADSGVVVTAALQAWGLVASYVENLEEQSEQAMEVFIEQLDSTDVEVQTSAGSNIALLFELARDYEEETGESFNLKYNQHKIVTRMSELVRESSKTISKKDRRHLRSNFTSIVISLERGKGPGYSTAGRGTANPHTGGQKTDGQQDFQEFGYRQKVRVHNQFMVIDTWSLQARVETLRAILGGGFAVHFLDNPLVGEILDSAEVEQMGSPGSRKKGLAEDSPAGKRNRRSLRGMEVF